MIKLIRKLVGKATRPRKLYICEAGEYWVDDYWNLHNIHYPEYYQQIKQTYWGVWKLESCWLGLFNPLQEVAK